MIHPAPTTAIDPSLARAVLESVHAATATAPAYIVLSFANTNYLMHLLPRVEAHEIPTLAARTGQRIIGTIHAAARRVDVVTTGGKYVEPVYGRPRRIQGTVISTDRDARTIVVNAALPIHCILTDPRQSAADFNPGDLVSFDALDGATFTPR